MIPVFTFVLDCDVDENLALLYPELYKELTLGKTLSYKTFGVWVLVSIYQGIVSFFSQCNCSRLRNHDPQQYPRRNNGRSTGTSHLRLLHNPRPKRINHDCPRNPHLAQIHDMG